MNFKITLKLVLGVLIMTIGYYTYQMYVSAKGVQTDIKNGINHPRKEIVFSERKTARVDTTGVPDF